MASDAVGDASRRAAPVKLALGLTMYRSPDEPAARAMAVGKMSWHAHAPSRMSRTTPAIAPPCAARCAASSLLVGLGRLRRGARRRRPARSARRARPAARPDAATELTRRERRARRSATTPNPKDRRPSALDYAARAARDRPATTRRSRCCSRRPSRHPTDRDVLGAYGKALADAGRPAEGAATCSPGADAGPAGLAALSAQGAVARPARRARAARSALPRGAEDRSPTSRRVLSNLGMSYVLASDLPDGRDAVCAGGRPAGRRQPRAPESRAGRSACRAASTRPRRSPRAGPAAGGGRRQHRLSARSMLAQQNTWAMLKRQATPRSAERDGRRRRAAARRPAPSGAEPVRSALRRRRASSMGAIRSGRRWPGEVAVRPRSRAMTWMTAGPMMTTNSTGRKNRIIGTVSFGGSAAAFFSASFMRWSRLSCASTRSAVPSGVP